MDLLVPGPSRSIRWSYETLILLQYKHPFRATGFLVDTRFPERSLDGLRQNVRILARFYSARQIYNAVAYLIMLREQVPDLLPNFTPSAWNWLAVKSDELDIKLRSFLTSIKEIQNGPDSD